MEFNPVKLNTNEGKMAHRILATNHGFWTKYESAIQFYIYLIGKRRSAADVCFKISHAISSKGRREGGREVIFIFSVFILHPTFP